MFCCHRKFWTYLNPLAYPAGRRRALNNSHDFVYDLITTLPTILLDEIPCELEERRGISVYIPTISSTLTNMQIIRNLVAQEAGEDDGLHLAISKAE